MRLKFFAVPALDPATAEEDVNRFLASHRVLRVESQLVSNGDAFWALQVSYEEGPQRLRANKGRIDYRQVLPEAEFQVYARLRSRRARRRWEEAYRLGLIDASELQTGYASALAITAQAEKRDWRRAELRRRPAVEA